MERKNSRSVFLKTTSFMENKRSALFPDVFPDACLGFRFGILPPAGQRSRTKHVLWPRLGNLASGGSKISKKTRPGKNKRIYSIYGIYRIYLYIFYTYSICYAENCVVDRDAAAAGQPPGQSSHPAARARGPPHVSY